jgi:hypothetical protein
LFNNAISLPLSLLQTPPIPHTLPVPSFVSLSPTPLYLSISPSTFYREAERRSVEGHLCEVEDKINKVTIALEEERARRAEVSYRTV